MKIRLMKAAIKDLRDVQAYIALDDAKAAVHVSLRLHRAIALIGDRPDIGRPGADHVSREWSVPGLPYVIPYRIAGDVIEIVRVWHTSRERPREW